MRQFVQQCMSNIHGIHQHQLVDADLGPVRPPGETEAGGDGQDGIVAQGVKPVDVQGLLIQDLPQTYRRAAVQFAKVAVATAPGSAPLVNVVEPADDGVLALTCLTTFRPPVLVIWNCRLFDRKRSIQKLLWPVRIAPICLVIPLISYLNMVYAPPLGKSG